MLGPCTGEEWEERAIILTGDSLAGLLGEGGGEVTLPGAAADGDDQLSFILRPLGHFQRHVDIGAGGDTTQQAFFLCQPTCHMDGVLIADGDDLVDNVEMEVVRHEAGAGPLDLMDAGFEAESEIGIELAAMEARMGRFITDCP